VTPGKSKPLVIIWVPTRISISPARSSASNSRARAAQTAGVGVHPFDARGRHHLGQRLREPLGAEALALEAVGIALGASVGGSGVIAAVMATERAVAHVKRHADAAVRARDHVAANVALQKLWNPRRLRKHQCSWPRDVRFSRSAATTVVERGIASGRSADFVSRPAPLVGLAAASLRASATSRRISTISTEAIARSFTRRSRRSRR